MRTGSEYRESLHDGRRVWVIDEGLIEDVTVHPATRPMVEEYVSWYDRHHDPDWQNVVLGPPDGGGTRTPWAFATPRSSEDLRGMGRSYAATTFPTAGNMTHTPGYGNLIALGIRDVVLQRKVSAEQLDRATRYRDLITRTGRFLTFCAGAATIGYRLREDPADRAALRIIRETDAGLVLSGKVGMHTSPAYAEDVYVGAHSGVDRDGHRATFVVPVAAPGVTVVCRKVSSRRSAAASTSWTGSCGSRTCWCRGSACSSPKPRRTRSRRGASGTSCTPGSPRPSSRWGWPWRAPTRWASRTTSRPSST